MKNKIITSGIIAFILFFNTAFCYGAQTNDVNSNTMDLGNQITESMNKAEKSAENLSNKVTNNNTVNEMKNMVDNGVGNMRNTVNGDYNVTRTSMENGWMQNTNMSSTTWIWIVLAVVGIIILATVWFYVMQNSGRD